MMPPPEPLSSAPDSPISVPMIVKVPRPKRNKLQQLGLSGKALEFAVEFVGQVHGTRKKNKLKQGYYVNYHAAYWKSLYFDYKKVIKLLEDNGIIKVNNKYSNNRLSPFTKSYAYVKNTLQWEMVELEKEVKRSGVQIVWSFEDAKKIGGIHVSEAIDLPNVTEFISDSIILIDGREVTKKDLEMYKKIMTQVTLDPKVYTEVENRYNKGLLNNNKFGKKVDAEAARERALRQIKAIENKVIYFKKSTCGRIFHNFNGMYSWMRKFILINNEPTVEVDIKASHPSITRKWVKKEKLQEWDSYIDKYLLIKLGVVIEEKFNDVPALKRFLENKIRMLSIDLEENREEIKALQSVKIKDRYITKRYTSSVDNLSRKEKKLLLLKSLNKDKYSYEKMKDFFEEWYSDIPKLDEVLLREAEIVSPFLNSFDSITIPISSYVSDTIDFLERFYGMVGVFPQLEMESLINLGDFKEKFPETYRPYLNFTQLETA